MNKQASARLKGGSMVSNGRIKIFSVAIVAVFLTVCSVQAKTVTGIGYIATDV